MAAEKKRDKHRCLPAAWIALTVLAVGCHQSGARIATKERILDLGRVKSGDRVERVIEFYNRGDKTLLLLDAWATCGCTVGTLSSAAVPPGDSGRLTVVFDSYGLRGRLEREVHLVSNDVSNPKLTFTLKADVIP